jgi:RNA polymerase sigma factor (sigma-70 family)
MTDLQSVVARFRQWSDRSDHAPSDTELLHRYIGTRDSAAFEVLVWRHGGLVFNACRRVLRNEHDVEDAFQATFIVLARKADTISERQTIGYWLYRVAVRIALRIRARAARQGESLSRANDLPDRNGAAFVVANDLKPVLDEEIDRLPRPYRAAFVLCHLAGCTRDQAARELGCPRGTVDSRVAWALARLRTRLTRRGLAPATIGGILAATEVADAVPPRLVADTIRVSTSGAELVKPVVQQLASEVLRAMFWKRCKPIAAGILVAIGLIGGVTWQATLTHATPADGQNAVPAAPAENDPASASWRLVLDLQVPARDLYALAYSPDGRLLAVAGRTPVGGGNPVLVFDAGTGNEVRRIPADHSVTCVAFSPDGKTLAVARSDVTRMYEVASGRPLNRDMPKDRPAHVAAFTRDGRHLLLAMIDGALVRWDPQSGKTVWEARDDNIQHFALSPDGKTVAVGAAGSIQLRDAVTGREVRRFDTAKRLTVFVAFSPDGKQLAATTNGEVALWDLAAGKRRDFGNPRGITQTSLMSLAFSPDGRILACTNGDSWAVQRDECLLINVATGSVGAALGGSLDRFCAVAFSPNGRFLATADAGGRLKVWERIPSAPTTAGVHGEFVADRLDQLVAQLLKSNRSDAEVLDLLYVASLGRLPTENEQRQALQRLPQSGNRSAGFSELLNVLTSSPEYSAHVEDLCRRSARTR